MRFGTPQPRSGLLFNLDSGRILWQRDPQRRLPIASLTKMMTALIVGRARAARRPGPRHAASAGLPGLGRRTASARQRVPLEALLDGLLLPSGNDAAIALAQHVAGTVAAFVAMMNPRAAQLGLGCTRYSSPSGFSDRDNYSCAADLAVLAAADLAQPRLARISSPAQRGRCRSRSRAEGSILSNNNPLVLERYPGITGLKTGYTVAAGAASSPRPSAVACASGSCCCTRPIPPARRSSSSTPPSSVSYGQAPVAAAGQPPGRPAPRSSLSAHIDWPVSQTLRRRGGPRRHA